MTKGAKDDRELLGDYARALAAVGEAPPSKRSEALKALELNTMGFLDLSKDANAVMDRAIDNRDDSALLAFTDAFEATRARLRAQHAASKADADLGDAETAPCPPPDVSPAPASPRDAPIPAAPAYVPFQPLPRPAPPPMVARPKDEQPKAPPKAPTKEPPKALPKEPPKALPKEPPKPQLGRGTVRMVTPALPPEPLDSKPVAAVAARGGDTIMRPPVDDDGLPPRERFQEPRLALMQYAALRAEVVSCPEAARAGVYARHQLTEAEDAAEAAAWNGRFSADRALFAQYMQLFTYFRGLSRR